jgi:ABC-type metal ion transport system substrate-binding protein
MGVNGDAKRRALSFLEQEGLIRITRESGKNPRVTIIDETE